ncbi:hypothetical protein [Nocardia sp. NPDC052566]|uniref:hypothetical protein n=1 Tax=Nocardia sp. NPDC052566 TaxID=3364330 RepID=UPI0037C6BB78
MTGEVAPVTVEITVAITAHGVGKASQRKQMAAVVAAVRAAVADRDAVEADVMERSRLNREAIVLNHAVVFDGRKYLEQRRRLISAQDRLDMIVPIAKLVLGPDAVNALVGGGFVVVSD